MPVTIQLQGVEVQLQETQLPTADGAQDFRVMIFNDPVTRLQVQVPMPAKQAEELGRALQGQAIEVAPAGAVPDIRGEQQGGKGPPQSAPMAGPGTPSR